jgi:hypothetical protein
MKNPENYVTFAGPCTVHIQVANFTFISTWLIICMHLAVCVFGRLEAQAGELVAAGEQFRIRRANVKDLDDLANLCAEAFTESALEQYPACKRIPY